MKLLIGITGKLGSGKDYITNNLVIPILKRQSLSYLQTCFADQLKVNVMSKYNIPGENNDENLYAAVFPSILKIYL